MIGIPEIADYEVRRELIRTGLSKSVHRLDGLKERLEYIPIQTDRNAADGKPMGRSKASRTAYRRS